MDSALSPRINQIACTVHRVCWSLAVLPCDRCQQAADRVWTVTRTAIDLDLDGPILLAVTVSVHRCRPCRHYFRAQPPFLRPDAIYAGRVVLKAIQAVYQDGLAMRRVPERLARDFWVQPSEKMVRLWRRAYAARLDFSTDYQPWIVESFSGVLCVDEVYQGELALLLAVDPAAPEGDRLVGYQLVHGAVDQATTAAFLRRLAAAGIQPDQVITDGSALYPSVLAEIWPTAAHQLCLFHETRRVTTAAAEVIRAIRKALPKPPPATRPTLNGRPRRSPPPADATDPAAEHWRWREATRQAGIRQVHALRRQGVSLHAISRQLGISQPANQEQEDGEGQGIEHPLQAVRKAKAHEPSEQRRFEAPACKCREGFAVLGVKEQEQGQRRRGRRAGHGGPAGAGNSPRRKAPVTEDPGVSQERIQRHAGRINDQDRPAVAATGEKTIDGRDHERRQGRETQTPKVDDF